MVIITPGIQQNHFSLAQCSQSMNMMNKSYDYWITFDTMNSMVRGHINF